jgi:hypothetical protein
MFEIVELLLIVNYVVLIPSDTFIYLQCIINHIHTSWTLYNYKNYINPISISIYNNLL